MRGTHREGGRREKGSEREGKGEGVVRIVKERSREGSVREG